MARIPGGEIERLKSEVAVERLVEAAGIALAKAGKDLLGRCPFHEDATASLVVTPAKNLWHCFGCGVGGGPIDWVMKKDGVSFRHAVERLREGCIASSSSSLAASSAVLKRSSVRVLPAPVALDADDQELLNQVIGYYHETLKASPEVLEYLKSRGLDHPELIDRFRLGFANRTLGLRLPEKNRLAGEAVRTRLQRIGLYRESGHEHFNGSLVVPVIDEAGNVTEVYGRKITVGLRVGTALHLYLPGPHRGVWNIDALKASREVIVCEALLDAMSFWCAGYRNVTAAYGVEGFTDEMLEAFKGHGVERVLIAYDRDDAGDRGADKLAERLIAAGIEPWRIQFPRGMDANEYACKVTPAERSLGLVIRKALWLGKGATPARDEPVVMSGPVLPLAAAVAAKEEPLIGQAADVSPVASMPPLPASPMPPAPALALEAELRGEDVLMQFGEGDALRRYRVRGLAKNTSYALLKVNVLVARTGLAGEAFHVDTLDLYAARARAAFIAQAAIELGLSEVVIRSDLGRVLLKLEEIQDQAIRAALEPAPIEAARMSEPEREAALALLRAPDLIERILADFEACGIVGERTNKLVGYLAATSRKLASPLAVAIQSSSAAGKTSLMDAVLAFMPEEERIKYSAMTGQSLFYMGSTNLKHKILAIVEEEGASRASYALKLLQSEGELTIASTGKDPATGNLVTQEYRVEGPVAMFLTTTAADIDPELQNRCLVFAIDEGRGQTQAIHARQRAKRSLEGLFAQSSREATLAVHRNAQRLLRTLAVLNPFAAELSFPDQATRMRRDHEKYLTLIDTIALVHQAQREVKTAAREGKVIEYIEVTLADIALANTLAHEVLGRSLDELPPQTRTLLGRLDAFVSAEVKTKAITRSAVRFTRREVREATGLGDTQLKIHLARLVDLEYVIAHRVQSGGFAYELLYDGRGVDGAPFVPGLINVERLGEPNRRDYDLNRSGVQVSQSGVDRPPVGPWSGGSRIVDSTLSVGTQSEFTEALDESTKTHSARGNGKHSSYPNRAELDLPLAASSLAASPSVAS